MNRKAKALFPGEAESGRRLSQGERTRLEMNRDARLYERLGRRNHLPGPCRHTWLNVETGEYETKILPPKTGDRRHDVKDPPIDR